MWLSFNLISRKIKWEKKTTEQPKQTSKHLEAWAQALKHKQVREKMEAIGRQKSYKLCIIKESKEQMKVGVQKHLMKN